MPIALRVLSLAVLALTSPRVATQDPEILHQFEGASAGDRLGFAVGGAGDVDGDGFFDVIVGIPNDDDNGSNSGSAVVYSGLTGEVLWRFRGNDPAERFGWSVAAAGDVDGDGRADVIVGAQLDDDTGPDAGSAWVFSGADGTVLHSWFGDAAGDNFGRSVSGARDVNGDGCPDLIVGAPHEGTNGTNAGMARVFSGADGSTLFTLYGSTAGDEFGLSVDLVADLGGDGRDEIIVGASQAAPDGPGYARIVDGATGTPVTTLFGEQRGDEFGFSVRDAGDVDADGTTDLVVGVPEAKNNGNDAGIAMVFSGAGFSVLHVFEGGKAFDYFGQAVDGAGDVNGDGHHDVLVGAPFDDGAAVNCGVVRIFSGSNGAVLRTWFGDGENDLFGRAVAGAGQVNGFGTADVIAGAWGDDNNGPESGMARVFCASGPASASTFGVGCPPARPLTLSYSGTASLGGTLVVDLSNGPAAGPAVGTLYFGSRSGPPFPIPLAGAGAPQCSLYHSFQVSVGISLAGGAVSVPLPIPSQSLFCGASWFNQAVVLDGSANLLGLVTSNAGQVTLGL